MTLPEQRRLQSIRPTAVWLAHFGANALSPAAPQWARAALTGPERRDVIASIQQFQLGESSSGRNLKRVASVYARRVRDPEYADAVAAFIAEEQAHAAWLGRYLDAVGEPCRATGLLDRIFRRLRKLAGIETAIIVLLTAELIAKIYYRALHDATRCPALRALCGRILSDERAHVEFHCERLYLMRCMRASWRNRLSIGIQRFLFAATLPAVWLEHRRPFRRAGFSYSRYREAAWREFQFARAVIAGEGTGEGSGGASRTGPTRRITDAVFTGR